MWTLPLKVLLAAAPAYDRTHGYFPIADGRIVAYDLGPGTREWIIDAAPLVDPVAGDGLLFVVGRDAITARRANDGTIAWQLPLADKLAVRPVWDNGWLVAATAAGSILALRANDGHRIWTRDVGSPAHAMPALAADRVYVPTADGRVVALQVETGASIWERRLGGAANEILALEDRIYVGSTDNYLYCLMAKDGDVDWRWRTGGDVIGVPIADEKNIYFVALDNMLRALNRRSGVQQWMRPLPLRPATGPVRAGPSIIVSGVVPSVRAYAVETGAAAGDFTAAGDIAAPPHVVPDSSPLPRLLVVTRDIATGATATLIARDIEPQIGPIAPLPNVIEMKPIAK